jgi:type VI secretion system protein ImpF
LLSDLKLSVRRDLENLLNTRINITSIPEDMPQLKRSLVNYGIPDFGRTILESGTAMESLRNRVEEAIRMYETRFKHVHVDFDEKAKSDRTVRFVIDGVLHAEPYPEPVVYRSQLNTLAREFRVLEANP